MDYVLSVHYSPLLLGATLSSMLLFLGCPLAGALSLFSGCVGAAGASWVQPLKTLRVRSEKGPSYPVRMEELEQAGEVPPITVFCPVEGQVGSAAPEKVRWLPFKDLRFLQGMSAYSRMPYVLFRDLQHVEVEVAAKSSPSLSLFKEDGTPRDIFIFSHGICGFARLYTTLLLHLASKGVLIFAVTHTDGSAAFCRDASNQFALPVNLKLTFAKSDREPQLRHRTHEMKEVWAALKSGDLLHRIGYAAADVERYLTASPCVHLIGHSFGGTTVLTTMTEMTMGSDTDNEMSKGPQVASVVCLDPWHVPLKEEMEVYYKSAHIPYATPTLLLFSEEWVRMDGELDYFQNILRPVCDTPDRMQIREYPGSEHISFCDMAVFTRSVGRKKYCTVDSKKQILDWAKEIFEFCHRG